MSDCEMVPAAGVAAIVLSEVASQRANGWKDWHPELFCHQCGRRNLTSWYVDSDLWNEVLPTTSIVCPQCFAEAWEAKHGSYITWELVQR